MTSTALSSTQAILDALKPNQTAENWLQSAADQAIDWDDCSIRAIALGLAPQLHARLSHWNVAIPPRAAAKLAVTYKAQAKRSQAIYAQLGQVLAACIEHDLHPIALKGIHLAAHIYTDPALRPMNDIDLLFEPQNLAQAEAMLAELGYGGHFKSAEVGARVTKHTSTFRREAVGEEERPSTKTATANPYLSTGLDRTVEPHSSLEESWYGLNVDITPGVRQRAVTVELAGFPCLVLNREDLLLHVCVHFCFHLIMGAPSLVQLNDILAVTEASETEWTTFLARTIDCGAAPYVYAALLLAHKLLEAPVPQRILDSLRQATPKSMRQHVEALDLAYILRRTQQKPLASLTGRIRRGFSDRMEIARWGVNWREKLRVWQTAVQFTKTDTVRQLLKR